MQRNSCTSITEPVHNLKRANAMVTSSITSRYTWRALLLCVAMLTAAPTIAQQSTRAKALAPPTASQAKAHALLMQMAEYLGAAKQFSVSVAAGYDAVQAS